MIQPIHSATPQALEWPEEVVPIEEMVKQFAVQQFVQALMGGDPELTGIPDLTAQDG